MRESWKFLRILVKTAVFFAALAVVFTWILGLYRMEGNNMFPSVKDGDLCITYKLEEYLINDVVLYRDDENEFRLGRIIAVEGQTVDFPENGGYLVNGYQPLEEILYQTFAGETKNVKYPLKIKKGTYFILNDFRSDTQDSRNFGTVEESQLCGKLIFVLRRRGF